MVSRKILGAICKRMAQLPTQLGSLDDLKELVPVPTLDCHMKENILPYLRHWFLGSLLQKFSLHSNILPLRIEKEQLVPLPGI